VSKEKPIAELIADEAARDVQVQYPGVDYLASTVYNAVLRAIEMYAKGQLK
jgi:hypothetical protein